MATSKPKAHTDTYKGNPVLHLPIKGSEKTFCFGLKKAGAIVDNMSDIVAFTSSKKPTRAKVKKYKSKPVLHLAKEGKPFSFGLKKAETILKHASEVIDFAASAK